MGVWVESKYRPEYCQEVIDILKSGKSKAAICSRLGITRPTLHTREATYPDFASAMNYGLQKAQELWEEKGERGIDGEIKNFGAAPWIFTMKNRFREDYAEEKSDNNSVPEAVVMQLIDRLVE